MIWIRGVAACLTKFASPESESDGGGGGVKATKALKASFKIHRHCSRLLFGGGSIRESTLEEGQYHQTIAQQFSYLIIDTNLIFNIRWLETIENVTL